MIHQLDATLDLPLPVDTVFAFFADASNLERITPPELKFKILTPTPIEIRPGTLIDYQLGLFFLKFGWRTEIRESNPPHHFVDVQLKGPYKQWIHRHEFTPVAGGTRITDHVDYELPLSPLGDVALPIIRLQLGRIFRPTGRTRRGNCSCNDMNCE